VTIRFAEVTKWLLVIGYWLVDIAPSYDALIISHYQVSARKRVE
jgi:hypothetical protein